MRRSHLSYLRCPDCAAAFELTVREEVEDRIKEGELACARCPAKYPIVAFIPRIVPNVENYADDFGFQWNKHYRTQYDSYSGVPVSEQRFFKETNWPRDMKGEVLLEAGSGSGRFTEQALRTGAVVVSFDYSRAVEANYRNNGHHPNLLLVQASIYEMPFAKESFDKVLCIGVVQHTPDPERSIIHLSQMLRLGGNIVIDAYERLSGIKGLLETKYWVRPLTRRIPNGALYRFCVAWVNFMWPVLRLSYRITGRRSLSWLLLIADYRGVYPLSEHMLKEWSILDTFDMLAPEYDFPQTIDSVTSWFTKAGFKQFEVKYGYNGIQASAVRT